MPFLCLIQSDVMPCPTMHLSRRVRQLRCWGGEAGHGPLQAFQLTPDLRLNFIACPGFTVESMIRTPGLYGLPMRDEL